MRHCSILDTPACRRKMEVEFDKMSECHQPETVRRMMNEQQVLEIIPFGRSTLLRQEREGKFPKSTYISPNRRVWYEDEIAHWQKTVDEFNPNRGRGKKHSRT
jgi:prophage regulatory protein